MFAPLMIIKNFKWQQRWQLIIPPLLVAHEFDSDFKMKSKLFNVFLLDNVHPKKATVVRQFHNHNATQAKLYLMNFSNDEDI